jgi:hypothetical protein
VNNNERARFLEKESLTRKYFGKNSGERTSKVEFD